MNTQYHREALLGQLETSLENEQYFTKVIEDKNYVGDDGKAHIEIELFLAKMQIRIIVDELRTAHGIYI